MRHDWWASGELSPSQEARGLPCASSASGAQEELVRVHAHSDHSMLSVRCVLAPGPTPLSRDNARQAPIRSGPGAGRGATNLHEGTKPETKRVSQPLPASQTVIERDGEILASCLSTLARKAGARHCGLLAVRTPFCSTSSLLALSRPRALPPALAPSRTPALPIAGRDRGALTFVARRRANGWRPGAESEL